MSIEGVETSSLAPSWRTDAAVTRRAGDQWLRSGRAALLRVPSVLVPATWNVLVNPPHLESGQLRMVRDYNHGIDLRLFR